MSQKKKIICIADAGILKNYSPVGEFMYVRGKYVGECESKWIRKLKH